VVVDLDTCKTEGVFPDAGRSSTAAAVFSDFQRPFFLNSIGMRIKDRKLVRQKRLYLCALGVFSALSAVKFLCSNRRERRGKTAKNAENDNSLPLIHIKRHAAITLK